MALIFTPGRLLTSSTKIGHWPWKLGYQYFRTLSAFVCRGSRLTRSTFHHVKLTSIKCSFSRKSNHGHASQWHSRLSPETVRHSLAGLAKIFIPGFDPVFQIYFSYLAFQFAISAGAWKLEHFSEYRLSVRLHAVEIQMMLDEQHGAGWLAFIEMCSLWTFKDCLKLNPGNYDILIDLSLDFLSTIKLLPPTVSTAFVWACITFISLFVIVVSLIFVFLL